MCQEGRGDGDAFLTVSLCRGTATWSKETIALVGSWSGRLSEGLVLILGDVSRRRAVVLLVARGICCVSLYCSPHHVLTLVH